MLLRLFSHGPTHAGQFAVFDFTQEKEGSVDVVRFHPFDGGAGLGQLLLERNRPGADRFTDVDADKRAETSHDSHSVCRLRLSGER